MRVGVGKADITPDSFYPLGGMHKTVTAGAVDMPLEARCFLVDDGERSALFVAIDVLGIANQTVRQLRETIHARFPALGACPVMIACTHTHSAPLTTFFAGNSANMEFLELLEDGIVSAVAAALETLKPACLSYGSTVAPNRTFNRRPIYKSAHGEQVGTHGPTRVDDFLRMESQPDEEIQIVVARDETGTCIGGIVGFACHPTLTGMEGVYSSDFCGSLVDGLDRALGGTFAFLQGASGDQCAVHPDAETDGVSGVAAARQLGQALADIAVRALSSGTALADDAAVDFASERLPIAQRAVSQERLLRARRYLETGPGPMTPQQVNREQYGFDYSFYFDGVAEQQWFANETVGMWEWQQRASVGPLMETLEVWAISIGDFAVAFLPVEFFSGLGSAVKNASPFPHTMIATLCNGWHGYVPTEAAFSRGGYEPHLGFQSRLDPQAGAKLTGSAGALLQKLHSTRVHARS
jgi:neutral ceramidase